MVAIGSELNRPESESEDGRGVVVPCGVDAYVAADGVQGAVPGLVGGGAIGGAAFVGVGDEAGAEGGDGAAAGEGAAGEDDELVDVAALVGLGPVELDDRGRWGVRRGR